MNDYARDLENLAVRHRAKQALRNLMAAGADATPALRRGLRHPDAAVRIGCCTVLDHYLDEAAVPELIANLEHAHEQVRKWALHALACDRCKEGSCRPAEHEIVPIAARMLREDPSRRVRVEAVHLLGAVAARHPQAIEALQRAHAADADPNVRSVARRYLPGGAIFERLAPTHRVMRKVGPRRPYPRKRRRASLALSR